MLVGIDTEHIYWAEVYIYFHLYILIYEYLYIIISLLFK